MITNLLQQCIKNCYHQMIEVHAVKQSGHTIPTVKSGPVLITNGMDEAARFHLTSNFVINAEEDGEIIDYNEDQGLIIAKYKKSGKCQAIDLNPQIAKNAGGGFFLSNKMTTNFKVGDKFKKDDALAWHKDYFTNNKFNNCRLNIGPLVKVAICSSYNTIEDSTFITHKLSNDLSTEMVFLKAATIGKNSNVFKMKKKGDTIAVGESLITFDTSYEDDSINTLLASLGAEDKENLLAGARNEIKSKYGGVIEEIKIYSASELEDLSPSLRKIVSDYYRSINRKKDYLNKFDPENKNSVVKCGLLMTDSSKKTVPNRFGVIKGEKVEDGVLIEFYIKHAEPLEIGSKIANYTALKNTVGEIIQEGYEPYSEFRKDEEISTIVASNSILNRMVPSILLTTLANKCIVELKRSLEKLHPNRKKMEDLIYKFFTAFDKSGSNTKYYKELFQPMTDSQFKNYFNDFFKDENAHLPLTIIDYERMIKQEDIERAADVLKIPLYEYVYMPHITMDKEKVVVTKEKVPVGYLNLKRTQQTLACKDFFRK